MHALRPIPLLALLCVLGACTTTNTPTITPPPNAPAPSEQERWAARLDAVGLLSHWRVRGKVAYRLPDDGGSASLDWKQADEQSELRLSGPLGVGSTEIRNEGALLGVTREGIERLYPADAAPWLPGGTLLPVPVASIQHWLRGVPDPALPVTLLNVDFTSPADSALTAGHAVARRIEQNGWVVSYEDYRDVTGLPMPARLRLENPRVKLRMNVILRSWDI